VGLFDQTSFGKILVQGRDAEAALNRLCTADIAVEPGLIVYTQWLNDRGGVESDVTVTRLDERSFLIVTSGTSIVRDLEWLRRRMPEDAAAAAVDVSNAHGVLGIMGPRSRELLASLTDADLSNEAFPFGASREIDLGLAFVRASRITYVGELGWELYVPTDVALHVYDTIVAAGEAFGLRHAGYHALNSLRLEKAYRHWGHDVTDEDTLLEAGLGFTAAWDKPGGFIGRDALLRQRETGLERRLAVLSLDDPKPLLQHNEPIWRDGELIGRISSGMFGHTVGHSVGLGYVRREGGPVTADWLAAGQLEVEVANERFAARASLRAPYDPDNARIRS
jgi:4-methylaminobutanoate oxidase (formaldehyde-forming)